MHHTSRGKRLLLVACIRTSGCVWDLRSLHPPPVRGIDRDASCGEPRAVPICAPSCPAGAHAEIYRDATAKAQSGISCKLKNPRSEERRGGEEGRSRWAAAPSK